MFLAFFHLKLINLKVNKDFLRSDKYDTFIHCYFVLAYEEIGSGYANVDLNTEENNVRHKFVESKLYHFRKVYFYVWDLSLKVLTCFDTILCHLYCVTFKYISNTLKTILCNMH